MGRIATLSVFRWRELCKQLVCGLMNGFEMMFVRHSARLPLPALRARLSLRGKVVELRLLLFLFLIY